jgi:2-succinyl-5-enolpyruvyl-6-hydroxy-3-cyclohexene-1-carboxylate synthase
MNTDKTHIRDIAEICSLKGINYAVVSPGSRNAPLVIAFNRHPKIKCISIPDERVAAFFALGMAQQLQEPVALICTSGSAAVNYAPAIVEAFYQNIPLLILTSDRPEEWIDQGDGQTIQQRNIYSNYIKKSFQLKQDTSGDDDLWFNNRIISDAINIANFPLKGPVHINVPLKEPLYNTEIVSIHSSPKIINQVFNNYEISEEVTIELSLHISQQKKVLIIIGMFFPNKKFAEAIEKIAEFDNVVILAETASNISSKNSLSCIDNALETFTEKEVEEFMPDLLITLGNNITSKRIKNVLRKNKPQQHWHVNETNTTIDTFASLTHTIICDPLRFVEKIVAQIKPSNSNYKNIWHNRNNQIDILRDKFMQTIEWSDIKVFSILLPKIPNHSQIQMGNSTPVRYIQLFNSNASVGYFGNRGTSGIDGCTSTAAGASYINENIITTLITGDVAFFYDSNALWNKNINSNFKIILINNSGGNIFRIIEGPSKVEELEEFFETSQNYTAKHICKTFGIEYFESTDEETLHKELKHFFDQKNKPALLEIFTEAKENATQLKHFFSYLKNNIH